MGHPAGETNDGVLRLDFDRRLMLQFCGSVVTSDAGLLPYRELDDVPGLTVIAGNSLADARTGKNGRHALVGLLRQSVFSRLAGYEDVNDAGSLRLIRQCLDCRRQSCSGVCSVAEPDGPLRGAVARCGQEPLSACRSFGTMD